VDHETDLRRELENAQAECARLREENTRLREQLLTHEEAQSFNYSTETPFRLAVTATGYESMIGSTLASVIR